VPLAFHSGREADHSPPSRAEVKKCVELYLYLYFPNTPSWRGVQLGGRTGTTLPFYLYFVSCTSPTYGAIFYDQLKLRIK